MIERRVTFAKPMKLEAFAAQVPAPLPSIHLVLVREENMNARGPHRRASLLCRLRHESRRKLPVLTGGYQHAVTGCRSERHGDDDFRIVRDPNPLSEVCPSPVEDKLTFAVLFEVRGRHRDEPFASPKGQVGWRP